MAIKFQPKMAPKGGKAPAPKPAGKAPPKGKPGKMPKGKC